MDDFMDLCPVCGGYVDPLEYVASEEEIFCSKECMEEKRREMILLQFEEDE
jgi:predicted nucleic acid-binding Zn ribbon protein